MRGRAGVVVAAAFLGPGTVATAVTAGASFGAALVWAVVASGVATFIVQEGAARVRLVTGRSVGAALAARGARSRVFAQGAAAAVVFGAVAFQAGNVLGVVFAVSAVASPHAAWLVVAAADAAFLLVWFGAASRLLRVLGAFVAFVAAAALVTVARAPVAWSDVAAGLVPTVPADALVVTAALVGTTVVPYNVFLHAGFLRGGVARDVPSMRVDLAVAVAVGVVATAALVVAAATLARGADVTGARAATVLASGLGGAGAWVFVLGVAAAALSSAVTAPLAAGFAVTQVQGRDAGPRDPVVRGVAVAVLALGAGIALVGGAPVAVIVLAQAANALVLPVVVAGVWVTVRDLAGPARRARFAANDAAFAVVLLVSSALAVRVLWTLATA